MKKISSILERILNILKIYPYISVRKDKNGACNVLKHDIDICNMYS
jgi:hypothetical protein